MASAEMTPQQIDDLVAENASLRRQVQETKEPRPPVLRRVIAIVLAVLAVVAIVASVQAVWLKTTLQDEDQFVATFEDLIQNEAVATALAVQIADGVIEATDAELFIASNLPPDLEFIAAPVTEAMRSMIANTAAPLIRSDAMNLAWSATLRATHVASSAVISGNGSVLAAEEGQVALDLDEITAVVMEAAAEAGLALPAAETSFGKVVLYESDGLGTAQGAAQALDQIGWVLPLIALLLVGGAVWAAPDRRWIAAFLGFGTALGMLLSLVSLRLGRNALLNGIENEVNREAGEAAWDIVLARLLAGSWGVLALGLLVGFLAWSVGPSTRAQGFSGWISSTVSSWRRPAEADPSGFSTFLAGSKRTIESILIAAGLLFLLFGPALSGVLVIVTALVVVGLIVLVEIFAGPAELPVSEPEPVDDLIDA